ncbi:MAG: hypothetical protein JWR80_8024 [Bradyrhizobium sp.]|nr:hypothetical protein [Bradyrhizobium sp.]
MPKPMEVIYKEIRGIMHMSAATFCEETDEDGAPKIVKVNAGNKHCHAEDFEAFKLKNFDPGTVFIARDEALEKVVN